MKLSHLKANDCATVSGFDKSQKAFRHKLLAMGITPGTSLQVIRLAPLGDPMLIQIRGFQLTLRKIEADSIKVEKQ